MRAVVDDWAEAAGGMRFCAEWRTERIARARKLGSGAGAEPVAADGRRQAAASAQAPFHHERTQRIDAAANENGGAGLSRIAKCGPCADGNG
mmetsp:Transcript_66628/g.185751  ORF Transcript_66628/g.185751 Transcript_66628/m.185751 type:complete len:92 (-) Transcript_66628:582-857(-)